MAYRPAGFSDSDASDGDDDGGWDTGDFGKNLQRSNRRMGGGGTGARVGWCTDATMVNNNVEDYTGNALLLMRYKHDPKWASNMVSQNEWHTARDADNAQRKFERGDFDVPNQGLKLDTEERQRHNFLRMPRTCHYGGGSDTVPQRRYTPQEWEELRERDTARHRQLGEIVEARSNGVQREHAGGPIYEKSEGFQYRFADQERASDDVPWRRQDFRSARSQQPSSSSQDWWSRSRWGTWWKAESGRTSSSRRQRWV